MMQVASKAAQGSVPRRVRYMKSKGTQRLASTVMNNAEAKRGFSH